MLTFIQIHLPTGSSSEWLWYVRGAMNMLQGILLQQQSSSTDIEVLLDWVYYHEALAHFTNTHWRNKPRFKDPEILKETIFPDALPAPDRPVSSIKYSVLILDADKL